MCDDWVFSIPSESNRFRTEGIDKKGKKKFMIPAQSILHGGLRFPLKKFFIEVLAMFRVATGQSSANAWRILTALYIGCHAVENVECLDATVFLQCYFIQATR